ncbi:MAG TPA: hypothetical protein PKI34_05635 [Bacteroidales bacterium]|nr:hypothetical protein [Bacteroidales bacterium]
MSLKSFPVIILPCILYLSACAPHPDHPLVVVETEAGAIQVELYPDKA